MRNFLIILLIFSTFAFSQTKKLKKNEDVILNDVEMNTVPHISHFGALKTSPTYPVFKANFPGSAVDTSLWDTTFVNTGSITVEKGVGRLFTGTNSTGSAKLSSKKRGIFEAGQVTVYQSGVLAGAGVASNTRRWGLMDAGEQNGLFFEWNGTIFQVTARKGGTDTSVTSANFNGESWTPGATNNTFRIHYSAGRAIFQRSANGKTKTLHTFINQYYPLVNDLDMGLYYENANSGNTSNVELRVRGASTSVFGQLPTSRPNSAIDNEQVMTLTKSVIAGVDNTGAYRNVETDRFGNLMTSNLLVSVSKGEFSDLNGIQKFGRNSEVDTGSDPETVWEAGGLKVWQTSAQTVNISSSSSNDDASPGGTGARTVELEGVDGSYVHVLDTVSLNGTSTVTSTQSFLNVYRARVLTAGSGGSNDGTLTGSYSSSADDAFGILSGFNRTQLAFYTTAAGETGLILAVNVYPFKQASASYEVTLFVRNFGGLFELRGTFGGHTQASGIPVLFPIPFNIPEKSDIEFRIQEVSSNNVAIAVDFLILSETGQN